MRYALTFFVLFLWTGFTVANDLEAVKLIQETSVNVKSGRSEGSGNLITREFDVDGKKEQVTFVLTAGHVVDDLRRTRETVDSDGNKKTVVEFDDAAIVREFRQNGRRVGETKLDCKVVKYSNADHGEDLAVLMVRKWSYSSATTEFFLEKNPPVVGTPLWHCGSLLGQMGANSVTTGVMSQIGRVYENKTYDQSTVCAFPGSSGGGVFLVKEKKPVYVGMVVRGAGETFNLIVPVRRIVKWCKVNNMQWLVNPAVKPPKMVDLLKMTIDSEFSESQTSRIDAGAKPTLNPVFLDGEHSLEWMKNGYQSINTNLLKVASK